MQGIAIFNIYYLCDVCFIDFDFADIQGIRKHRTNRKNNLLKVPTIIDTRIGFINLSGIFFWSKTILTLSQHRLAVTLLYQKPF